MLENFTSKAYSTFSVLPDLFMKIKNGTEVKITDIAISSFVYGLFIAYLIFCYDLLFRKTKYSKFTSPFLPTTTFILVIETKILMRKILFLDKTVQSDAQNLPILQIFLILVYLCFIVYFLYQSCTLKISVEIFLIGIIYLTFFLLIPHAKNHPVVRQGNYFFEFFGLLKSILFAYFLFLIAFCVFKNFIILFFNSIIILVKLMFLSSYIAIITGIIIVIAGFGIFLLMGATFSIIVGFIIFFLVFLYKPYIHFLC